MIKFLKNVSACNKDVLCSFGKGRDGISSEMKLSAGWKVGESFVEWNAGRPFGDSRLCLWMIGLVCLKR